MRLDLVLASQRLRPYTESNRLPASEPPRTLEKIVTEDLLSWIPNAPPPIPKGTRSSLWLKSRETTSLDEVEIGQWRDWSTQRLKKIQAYLDLAETRQWHSIRDPLMGVANELVIFYGYAEFGDAEKMVSSLERIRQKEEALAERWCGASPSVSVLGPKK